MPRSHTLPANQCILLSLPDAAAMLGVSLNTLSGWVDAGEIPLTRLPAASGTSLKRVHRRDLDAFAERHRDRPRIAGRRRTA